MAKTILSTYDYTQYNIGTKGDGFLLAWNEPFVYDQHNGAYSEALSAPDQFLTWSYLEGVVVAMYNALYLRGKYKSSSFDILDEHMGVTGHGFLSKRGPAFAKRIGNRQSNETITA